MSLIGLQGTPLGSPIGTQDHQENDNSLGQEEVLHVFGGLLERQGIKSSRLSNLGK